MSRPFGHDIPRLSWVGAKTFAQNASSRKNKSGNAMEHAEANKTNLLMAADALHIDAQPEQVRLAEGK